MRYIKCLLFIVSISSMAMEERALFECSDGIPYLKKMYISILKEANSPNDLTKHLEVLNKRAADKDDELYGFEFGILGHGDNYKLVTTRCETAGIATNNSVYFQLRGISNEIKTLRVYNKRNAWNEFLNSDNRGYQRDSNVEMNEYFKYSTEAIAK